MGIAAEAEIFLYGSSGPLEEIPQKLANGKCAFNRDRSLNSPRPPSIPVHVATFEVPLFASQTS